MALSGTSAKTNRLELNTWYCRNGGTADAEHSKCFVRKDVWVRIPLPAPRNLSSRPQFQPCALEEY